MSAINKVVTNNAINPNTNTFKYFKAEQRFFNANDTYSNRFTKVVDGVLTMFVNIFIIQWTNISQLKRLLKTKMSFVEEYQSYIDEEKVEIGRIQNYLNSINETDILSFTNENIGKDNINIASGEYSDEMIWNVLKFTVENRGSIIKEVVYQYLNTQNIGTFNREIQEVYNKTTHKVSKIPVKKLATV